jgi:hypothetical protein
VAFSTRPAPIRVRLEMRTRAAGGRTKPRDCFGPGLEVGDYGTNSVVLTQVAAEVGMLRMRHSVLW